MEDQTGMATKYALISGTSIVNGLVFKVYEVKDVDNKGSSIAAPTVVEPVIGQYYSIKKGSKLNITDGQIFDTVEEAVEHARNLVYDLKTTANPDDIKDVTPYRFFDAIFNNKDNEKLLKMAKNLTDLEKEYEKWQRS